MRILCDGGATCEWLPQCWLYAYYQIGSMQGIQTHCESSVTSATAFSIDVLVNSTRDSDQQPD